MRAIMAVLLAVAAVLLVPTPSAARAIGGDTVSATADAPMFAGATLADDDLSSISGGQASFPARLTVRTAYGLVDDAARADLRQTAGLARTTMDVWWGSIGSELIAANVRASGRS